MVTDRYQHVEHHEHIEDLVSWASQRGLPLVGVDNLPGSVPLETFVLPREVHPGLRSGGAGAVRGRTRGVRRHSVDRAVRVNSLDQCWSRVRHCDAQLDPTARKPTDGLSRSLWAWSGPAMAPSGAQLA